MKCFLLKVILRMLNDCSSVHNKTLQSSRGDTRDNNTYKTQEVLESTQGFTTKCYSSWLRASDKLDHKPRMSLDHKISILRLKWEEQWKAGKAPGTLQCFCLQSWKQRERENERNCACLVVDNVSLRSITYYNSNGDGLTQRAHASYDTRKLVHSSS